MDFTAFLAGASLTAGRIVVLDLNGNIKILAPGQAIAPGELVIETLEETDVPQFRIATDAGETNITDDIQQIFAALEEGQDPTQLGDDFATAAGETGGSSLVAGGTISRTGAESLASTDFSTQGLQALGLSETQSLALANQLRAFNDQITIVEPTPDERPAVSSISSPTVSEGDKATFDVSLSNASTTATTVTLTLAGDSATAGTDFTSTEVTITYQDGATQTVAVNGDGTFDVAIPAGDTTFSISVQTADDNVFEGDETFTLSGQTATQTTATTGTATLKDDGSVTPPDGSSGDDRPAVSSISSPTVSEGDKATFDVSLSNESTTATTVTLTLAGDSATAGTDFTSTEVTITYQDGTTQTVAVNGDGTFDVAIPAGDTTFSISVQTTDDNVFEGDETFTLSGQTATQTTATTGTATLKDDGSVTPPDGSSGDDRPAVSSISSPTVSEGDSATFDVSLSNASTTATTVTLTLAGDSATAGTDFISTEVTITYQDGTTQTVAVNGDGTFDVAIPAGDTTFSISVQTTDDNVFEGDETFTLSGQTATQATTITGTATLKDDGSVTPPDGSLGDDRPAVSSISSPTVSEGDSATFDVSLSNASTTATTVTLTLAGGSATAGTDFINTSVTITYENGATETVTVNGDGTFEVAIPAGDTTFSISVQTTNDNVFEGDETFTLSGKTATQAAAITGTATLKDDGSVTPPDGTPDDDRPSVDSISSPTVSEGDNATFNVSLSNASTTETTVTLTLEGGSATAGTDFTDSEVAITYQDGSTQTVAVNGDGTFEVAIPAGDTTFSISVQTTDDSVFEGDETFTLGGKTATQSSAVTGIATITDETTTDPTDPNPKDTVFAQISVDQASVTEGGELTYTITLVDKDGNAVSVPAGQSVEVALNWSGAAAGGADTSALPSSVTVMGGSNNASFKVQTTDDALNEGSEALNVQVTGVTDTNNSFEHVAAAAGNAGQASSTITDETTTDPTDPNPKDTVFAQISVDQASVTEGGELTYTITLVDKDGNAVSVPAGQSVEVALNWSGAAAGGADTSALP
ncbi:Calx-beta domain-containing protein, partial [Vibrio vulnificus]|uniref:Calx-beta domain-containing protein n=1 Tax=Vibrio vulnificus TaxID=672 RepID=UPI0010E7E931